MEEKSIEERQCRMQLLADADNVSNTSIERMKRAMDLLGDRLGEIRLELVDAVDSKVSYPESFYGFHHKVDLLRDHMRELIYAMNRLHAVKTSIR